VAVALGIFLCMVFIGFYYNRMSVSIIVVVV